MGKDITKTSDTVVWEQERSINERRKKKINDIIIYGDFGMGDRHIRIGNQIFHMVGVPDNITDATIEKGIKLNLMIIEKRKINASIEKVGIIAS